MDKIIRTPCPSWLAEKWQQWGEAWQSQYRDSQKSSDFNWRSYQSQGYRHLLASLSAMTQQHCSFCDVFPMGSRIKSTIEHFRPKTQYPLLAYHWENLFLCCTICQEKGDRFDQALLKPDDNDYRFDDYFDINWLTGELMPNEDATAADQQRAALTICLYKLNANGKPEDRLRELNIFSQIADAQINDFSYRFFLQRG